MRLNGNVNYHSMVHYSEKGVDGVGVESDIV